MIVKLKVDGYLSVIQKEYEGRKYFVAQVLATDKDFQGNLTSEIINVSFKPEQVVGFEKSKSSKAEFLELSIRKTKAGNMSINLV